MIDYVLWFRIVGEVCFYDYFVGTLSIKADRPLMRNTLNAPWLLTDIPVDW